MAEGATDGVWPPGVVCMELRRLGRNPDTDAAGLRLALPPHAPIPVGLHCTPLLLAVLPPLPARILGPQRPSRPARPLEFLPLAMWLPKLVGPQRKPLLLAVLPPLPARILGPQRPVGPTGPLGLLPGDDDKTLVKPFRVRGDTGDPTADCVRHGEGEECCGDRAVQGTWVC